MRKSSWVMEIFMLMIAMISWFKTDQISYFRYMYFSSLQLYQKKNWKLKTRITYQIAFCNNYNVFVDILPLHLRFVKDITIENWGRLLRFFVSKIYYISCQREIKHATFCLCQGYLKISNLQPRIYEKEWNRDIWKGNYSITSNTEKRQGRSDTWEINISIDHHDKISIENLLHECYGLRT